MGGLVPESQKKTHLGTEKKREPGHHNGNEGSKPELLEIQKKKTKLAWLKKGGFREKRNQLQTPKKKISVAKRKSKRKRFTSSWGTALNLFCKGGMERWVIRQTKASLLQKDPKS